MSLLEIVGSILTELEKVHQKLDRLLASKVANWEEQERKISKADNRLTEMLNKEENPTETEKEEEFDNTPIIWVKHNGMEFKACKYKCGYYVSWDNTVKKYIHYDAEFKLIGKDCPKYATPEGDS